MGKAPVSLLFIIFLLIDPLCHAQTSVVVSDPRLEIRDNTLLISYDILNSDRDEKYIISIDIKNDAGELIKANTLEGDIGEIEDGRGSKQITWDLSADNIFINSYVNVKIHAWIIPPPEPITEEPEKEITAVVKIDQVEKQEDFESNEIKSQDIPMERVTETPKAEKDLTTKELSVESETITISRTGLILLSVVLPGSGLTRATGKPHWIRGVVGYGCLASSIVFNVKAVNTFNEISRFQDAVDVENAFNKSLQQDHISEFLAYAAIGVWVTDIVWTIVGTSDLGKRSTLSQAEGISIGSTLDPYSYTPMVKLRYTF